MLTFIPSFFNCELTDFLIEGERRSTGFEWEHGILCGQCSERIDTGNGLYVKHECTFDGIDDIVEIGLDMVYLTLCIYMGTLNECLFCYVNRV
jgi:hypothetical protein